MKSLSHKVIRIGSWKQFALTRNEYTHSYHIVKDSLIHSQVLTVSIIIRQAHVNNISAVLATKEHNKRQQIHGLETSNQ